MLQRNVKIIHFMNPNDARVECDRKCTKAWGISSRPKINLSDDEDDIVWLADAELGDAPKDPGTREGAHGKPFSPDDFPNKWCVRQCERCAMSNIDDDVNETLTLPDFSVRVYNLPQIPKSL